MPSLSFNIPEKIVPASTIELTHATVSVDGSLSLSFSNSSILNTRLNQEDLLKILNVVNAAALQIDELANAESSVSPIEP